MVIRKTREIRRRDITLNVAQRDKKRSSSDFADYPDSFSGTQAERRSNKKNALMGVTVDCIFE